MWGNKREYIPKLFWTQLFGLLPVCERKLKIIQKLGMYSAFVFQYREYREFDAAHT